MRSRSSSDGSDTGGARTTDRACRRQPRAAKETRGSASGAFGELLAADAATFTAPPRRQDRYSTAAFLVRFLLAPGNPRRERFHGFLASIAAGGATDRGALEEALGEPVPALENAFAAWLQRTALAGGE